METGLLPNYNEELLLGEISSGNILLLNVIYHKPRKEYKYHDYASVVVKDVSTNEKRIITIENPQMLMYVVKPEYRDYTYCPAFKPLKETYQKRINYKDSLKEIAEIGGKPCKDFLAACKANNFNAARNLHKYPYILGTDYDYPSYFRIEWMLHYHNYNIDKNITKVFLDIEVDGIDVPDLPTADVCPINAVSVVDEYGKSVHVFLLRNPKNPLIAEFESGISSFVELCHNTFDESYGELNYEIYMYDSEIVLIQQVWSLINTLKRDFLLIWNMAFDIPYFIDRIKALGYDPRDIMCSPDFVHQELFYHHDNFHFDFKTKNDSFTVSSYTTFLDQMGTYIKIRKAKSELKSVKLNVIAQAELGDEKLDYSDEANIKTLPYVNYTKFVLYNIKDTLLQLGIERKTHDIDNIFDRSLTNATQYQSAFSQTILLKNRAYLSYYKQGYIIGNNPNVDYSKDRSGEKEKKKSDFEGALVADPLLNSYVGAILFGKPSKFIMLKVVDFDYSSMYPNIIYTHNIGPESMIGKLLIKGFEYLNPDPTDDLFDDGREFFEAVLSRDYSHLGSVYFNLPKTEDILADLEEVSGV